MKKHLFLCVLCLLGAALLWGTRTVASGAAPLLQEGKKSLYQRVISHPGARLVAAPASAQVVRETVVPFTVFYVYARSNGWVQVGAGTSKPQGWLEESRTTAWNQALTLLFTPRTSRAPVLFFKTDKALSALCSASDMSEQVKNLVRQAMSGSIPADSPLLACECDESEAAVSARRFYIMPILGMSDPFDDVKFLNVASIDPGTAGKRAPVGPPKTGIALVMDTSISMKPYIDQSRDVVRRIYDQLEKQNMTDNVGFAVVAFRSSTAATPGLGYTSTVVSDFATAKDRKALEDRLAEVQEAAVSSHDFNEDSLAGIYSAVEKLNWADYSSRLILLITDAGPLRSDDRHASVTMGPVEMNDLARQKGIWITALHIKSPGGARNHAYAEQSYRSLSRLSGNKSNYLAIKAPDAATGARQFGSVAATLAEGMVSMVKSTVEGKTMTRPRDEAAPSRNPADQASQMAAALGYAMQLQYLGESMQKRAPTVVNSWIADMDLDRLASAGEQVPAVEVAVLLTKNQLNDLSTQLKIIIDNAERTKKTDSRDFFQGILSASAQMARDPNMPTRGKNLAQLGILSEFLDGLPCKSDIMLLREEDWYRMSIGEQTAFINRLKSRLARYGEYDRDRANWESFGQADAGDWVYRVPLNMLP